MNIFTNFREKKTCLQLCLAVICNSLQEKDYWSQTCILPQDEQGAENVKTRTDTRTSKKGSWSNEQINNCTCITESNRSLSRGGHFVPRDKKKALYLLGHLVLTARLTVQKQSFLNLLGRNGPRDKGLFTFYGRRVNGPSENISLSELKWVLGNSTPGRSPHLAKWVSWISDDKD